MMHFRPMTRLDALVIAVGTLAALVYFGAPVFSVELQDSLLWFTSGVLVGVNLWFVGKLLFSKQ